MSIQPLLTAALAAALLTACGGGDWEDEPANCPHVYERPSNGQPTPTQGVCEAAPKG